MIEARSHAHRTPIQLAGFGRAGHLDRGVCQAGACACSDEGFALRVLANLMMLDAITRGL